jgi:hypothetical protein
MTCSFTELLKIPMLYQEKAYLKETKAPLIHLPEFPKSVKMRKTDAI